MRSGAPTGQQAVQLEGEEELEEEEERQAWPVERREAETLVAGLMELWGRPSRPCPGPVAPLRGSKPCWEGGGRGPLISRYDDPS